MPLWSARLLELGEDVLLEGAQHLPRLVGRDARQQRVEHEPAAPAESVAELDGFLWIVDLVLDDALDDVVHVDSETRLQVIASGHQAPTIETKQDSARFARIIEALLRVYHFIVLHADHETAFNYQPVLAGRLHTVVAVLASGEGKSANRASAALAGFGCTVLMHEQSAERRWFPRRSA